MRKKGAMINIPKSILVILTGIFGYLLYSNGVFAVKASPQDNQNPSFVLDSVISSWTIGIYTGPSPFQLSPPINLRNPVLTAADVNDLDVDIVAHPFMIFSDSIYYLFFTAKDGKTDMGGIGMAESRNGFDWKYRQIVVQEPYVLSYPNVFKWKNDYYMIPEAHTEKSVRLYKAVDFPEQWKYKGDLLNGDDFISTTVIQYNDMWWMYTIPIGNETLRLFYALDLMGPWNEHPQSPIVEKDLNTARPGGRPFVIDGVLYRLGQDCYPTYGNQVRAFQVTSINTKAYSEKMIDTPLVKSSSKGWNAEAMHHLDVHQVDRNNWIGAVDALGK